MKNSAQRLASLLKERELTIAFAESVTCGLAAHHLGSTSHTSQFFKGCVVCYHESVKTGLLQVKPAVIKRHTAESQQVTDLLAKGLRRIIKADVCAAVTGLAAPGGSETKDKPVGTVFFSIYYKRRVYQLRKRFVGTPLQVKRKACKALCQFVIATLLSE